MLSRLMTGSYVVAGALILLGQLPTNADLETSSTTPSTGASAGIFQPVGGSPDVIVWDLQSYTNYSAQSGYDAYSLGTTSCNIGTEPLAWISNTNQHPVIGQNMYRLRDDARGHARFEHIGQSWLKHGFYALDLNTCGDCQGTGGSSLGINCADPYTASRNGSQSNLGPKYQVNASTGYFPYPPANPSYSGSTARRLRVPVADVTGSANADARYFVEGHYVHPDDSPDSGNTANNASYREVNLNSGGNITGFQGSTQQMQAAVRAWYLSNPGSAPGTVKFKQLRITGQGNIDILSCAYDNGDGTWDYEYAIHNLDFDRSIGGFSVPGAATITNAGFHAPEYHSGEIWDQDQWEIETGSDTVSWSTESYSQNTNASAIRWGTMYNFRFTANSAPALVEGQLTFFKPGSPSEELVEIWGPDSDSQPPPDNDDCSDAILVTVGATMFTTNGATTDGPDEYTACNSGGYTQIDNDIWFRFTAPADGTLVASTCGSTFDTRMALYLDICPEFPSTYIVQCDDDSCGQQSLVTTSMTEGLTLRIRVGGTNGATGDGSLIIDFTEDETCPEDLDGSGAVDFGDILAVLSAWGSCGSSCPEDIDESGSVDFGDILAVLSAWGGC